MFHNEAQKFVLLAPSMFWPPVFFLHIGRFVSSNPASLLAERQCTSPIRDQLRHYEHQTYCEYDVKL